MFGESFVKNLGRYVGTFSSFDKAHTSMRKVSQKRVSTRASRSRSCLSGCNASCFSVTEASSLLQPLFKVQEMHQQFFPVVVGPGELDKTEVLMDPEDLMVLVFPGVFPSLFKGECLGTDYCSILGSRNHLGLPYRPCGPTAAELPPVTDRT